MLRSYILPPEPVKLIMEAIIYAFNLGGKVPWKNEGEGKNAKKVQDFWDYSKKSLLNDKLLKNIQDFKDEKIASIPPENIKKIRLILQEPSCEKEKIFKCSKASGNISLWVKAVSETYDAIMLVGPKRQELEKAIKEV